MVAKERRPQRQRRRRRNDKGLNRPKRGRERKTRGRKTEKLSGETEKGKGLEGDRVEKRQSTVRPSERGTRRERRTHIYRGSVEERQVHPCAAVAVAVAETEPALVIYINPIIAWRFPN